MLRCDVHRGTVQDRVLRVPTRRHRQLRLVETTDIASSPRFDIATPSSAFSHTTMDKQCSIHFNGTQTVQGISTERHFRLSWGITFIWQFHLMTVLIQPLRFLFQKKINSDRMSICYILACKTASKSILQLATTAVH